MCTWDFSTGRAKLLNCAGYLVILGLPGMRGQMQRLVRYLVENRGHRANHMLPRRDSYPSIRKAGMPRGKICNTTNFVLSRILLLLGQHLTSVVGGQKSSCGDSALATPGLHTYPCSWERNILCDGCFVFLTVHHILLECPNYVYIQRRIYGAAAAALTISNVLGDDDRAVDKLFRYLREINIQILWSI